MLVGYLREELLITRGVLSSNSMERYNNLPPLNAAIGGSAGISYQDDVTEPKLWYQGRSVQALNSPRSVYFDQSNANQKMAYSIDSLNERRVGSLMQADPDNFDGLDLSFSPESFLDDYASWNSDVDSFDDTLFSALGSDICNHIFTLGDEPATKEPTPANCLNLNHHLTDLPAELANPQDSRPFAVVNPLILQQATSENPTKSAEIVDAKSSQGERKKQLQRERYRTDPAYAERQRERQRELRRNPAYAERERKRQRERRRNPAYAERQRERRRERRKNLANAESKRESLEGSVAKIPLTQSAKGNATGMIQITQSEKGSEKGSIVIISLS